LVQFWVKFLSDDLRASIAAYNNASDLLRHEGIAYPVHNILNYSDARIYEFPLDREEYPLDIMQQCHSLLRAASFSHETVDMGEGLQTLPAIRDLRERGLPWNPVDLQDSDKTSREVLVHRLLQSVHGDNAAEALYDDRFVSEDSVFCAGGGAEAGGLGTAAVELEGLEDDDFWQFNVSDGRTLKEYVDNLRVPLHGFYAKTMGDFAQLCPCSVANGDRCCLAKDDAFRNDTCAAALREEVNLDDDVCFARDRAMHARRVFASAACESQACPSNSVSDLSGVLPVNTSAYFRNETPGVDWTVDGLDLLMFPVGGATLSTLRKHNDSLAHFATERRRRLDLADARTTVSNPLCSRGGTPPTAKKVATLGLPVVAALWESPATAACVRYVFERQWLQMVRDLDINDTARLAQVERDVETWQLRCQVKLQKLSSCRTINAFHPEFVQRKFPSQTLSPHCPFTLEDGGSTLALAAGPCVVLRFSEADHTYTFYDPYKCVAHYSDTMVRAADLTPACEMFNPFDMLHDGGAASSDSNVTLLSADFVGKIQSDADYRKNMAFAGADLDTDFLFPEDDDNATEHRQCPASVPYWPREWQYPFGEVVSDTWDYGTGYSSYMAVVVESDAENATIEEVAVLPRLLRPDKVTQTQTGSSGFCREPSFGMEVGAGNVHRVCADFDAGGACSESQITDGSDMSRTCSDTAAHRVGAGHGHTVGFLYPFLRPFVERNATTGVFRAKASTAWAVQKLANVVTLFHTYGENLDLDLDTGGPGLEEYVRSKCSFDAYLNDTDRDLKLDCYTNRDCQEDQACTAEGKCSNITLSVDNTQGDEDIEFGMSGLGCEVRGGADAIAGASPWQKVAGFLHAHGFCSHKEAVTFERMVQVYKNYAKSGVCRQGSNSSTRQQWVACPRRQNHTDGNLSASATWDWINHPPESILAPFNDPAGDYAAMRNPYLYEYSADEAREPLDVHELSELWNTASDFLRLQPHLCDMEYHHAQNLGWVHLRGQNAPARWMRMAEKWSEVVLPISRRSQPTEDGKCKEILDGNNCLASSKLRFMGFTSKNLKYGHDDQPQEVVTVGEMCGLCETEHFTYAGTRLPRLNQKRQLKDYGSTLLCGAFGHGNTTGEGVTECELDKDVAPLVYVLMVEKSEACSEMVSMPKSDLFYLRGETLFYSANNKEQVTTFLEQLFIFDSRVWDQTLNQRQRRHSFLQCVDDVIAFKSSHRANFLDAMETYCENTTPRKYRRGLNVVDFLRREPSVLSGMYAFTAFNTYEVPMLYWQKLGLESYVHYRTHSRPLTPAILLDWKDNTKNDVNYQQFAWEARFGHATAPLSFSGSKSNSTDIQSLSNDASALYHRLTDLENTYQDHRLSVKALWAALNTKQLVPEQSEFVRYVSKAIGEFIQTNDTSLFVSDYEFGQPKQLRLAEVPHVTDRTGLHTESADFRAKFSQLLYDNVARNTTLRALRGLTAAQGKYSMLNQYEHRTVAAMALEPEWWVYHGSSHLRSLYPVSDVTSNHSICSGPETFFSRVFPVNPSTVVSAGAWVNCSGRIFVPSVGTSTPITTEEPLFALGNDNDVDMEKDKHQFVGDVVDFVFFERDRGQAQSGISQVKVKYFDPAADTELEYSWTEGGDFRGYYIKRQNCRRGACLWPSSSSRIPRRRWPTRSRMTFSVKCCWTTQRAPSTPVPARTRTRCQWR
jgi:hypothetical protein